MTNALNKDGIKYLVSRLIENAIDASEDTRKDRKDEFKSGRNLAYYEMLSIIQNELGMDEEELEEIGLNIDLEDRIV